MFDSKKLATPKESPVYNLKSLTLHRTKYKISNLLVFRAYILCVERSITVERHTVSARRRLDRAIVV